MLLLYLVILLLYEAFSKGSVLDTQFKVYTKSKDEIGIFLDFKCPSNFHLYENKCFLNRSELKCPDLKDLNTSYTIIPFRTASEQSFVMSTCSYPIEDFLQLTSKNNSIKLELLFDTTEKSFKLYLEVTMKEPIEELQSKISCLLKKDRTYPEIVSPVEECYKTAVKNDTIRRFCLNTTKTLSMFYCYVVSPGEIKPIGSNVVFANNMANQTFVATIKLSRDSKISKYIVAIDDPGEFLAKRTLQNDLRSYDPSIEVIAIINNRFCLEEKSNTTGILWPQTNIKEAFYPKNRLFIKRRCEGNYYSGAKWSSVEVNCPNKSLCNVTKSLVDLQDEVVTNKMLEKLLKIIQEEDIQEIDVGLISNILSESRQLRDVDEQVYFKLINKILESIKLVKLSESIKEKVINVIEKFVDHVKKTPNKSERFSNNIEYKYDYLVQNESLGYKLNGVEVILRENFLNSLDSIDNHQKSYSITIIVFNIKELFPSNDNIRNKIVDIKLESWKVTKRNEMYQHPIVLKFPRPKGKYRCSFWDEHANKWSVFGVETVMHKDTIECRTYHLTRFALLIVSSDVGIYNDVINIVSRMELAISAFGVLIVLLLAITSPEWRKERYHVVQLSLVVLLESCLVLMYDIGEKFLDKEELETCCIYIGVTLHFIVLKKFLLMFLIGLAQLNHFMKIFKKTKKIFSKISCNTALLRWLLPFCIALVSAVCFSQEYVINDMFKFCYPRQEAHVYFVIIPVTIVLSFNAVVFGVVMSKISCSNLKNAQNKLFQFKLSVMLWFMLGGTWIIGVLLNILPEGIYQSICYYVFSLVAPLHGFVIFLFYIILDRSTKLSWKISFWSPS